MTFTEQEVERIVVEVIRRLGLLDSQYRSAETRVEAGNPNGRELTLVERIVTLQSIEGQLAGVQSVIVEPSAVVTPAVRDELKQRRIRLIYKNST
jgi:hypothetical protein